MSARGEARLWLAQRLTAAILAPCVLAHLVTIVWAVRGGLTAQEILARTHANPAWGVFYSVFVLAAAVHGSIGLRAIAIEWLGLRGPGANALALAAGLALAALGLRAVAAVAL